MNYDERIADYMLLVASNLIVSVASKNPEKMRDVLVDIDKTIDSYVEASQVAVMKASHHEIEGERNARSI